MPSADVLTLRPAAERDVSAVAALINAAFIVERAFVDRDRTDVDEIRSYPDGTAMACVYVEARGERAYIGMLAVDPARQRGGLGRQMMAAAEEYCRAQGCRAVDIRVVNLRTELPPFYRALGYVDCGTAPFVDPKATKPAHFLLMAKDLR